MKTTNVILIGVVGVGAVGAYMFLKNKKAKDALLSGSLPATTPTGTPPTETPPTETPPLATTPLIPTPKLIKKVEINKDTNLDDYNLQQTLDELKNIDNKYKVNPYPARINQNIVYGGSPNPAWESWNYSRMYKYPKERAIIVEKLAKLGYKFDKGLLIKI